MQRPVFGKLDLCDSDFYDFRYLVLPLPRFRLRTSQWRLFIEERFKVSNFKFSNGHVLIFEFGRCFRIAKEGNVRE